MDAFEQEAATTRASVLTMRNEEQHSTTVPCAGVTRQFAVIDSGARSAASGVGQALWPAAADDLPVAVFAFDSRGRVDFANRFARERAGLRAESSLAAWMRAIHPDDRRQVFDAIRLSVSNAEIFEGEFRLRHSDGEDRLVQCVAAPHRDDAGTVACWLGMAIDVEERAQAIALCEAANSRLQTFSRTVPQIVWTADSTGAIDWYSDRWFEYTGQTPEQAAGWGWQDAHHPEDFPKVMERWPRSIETGEPFELEFRLRGADGRFRWFLTHATPHFDAKGRVSRWYGSNTDIEHRKQSENRSVRVAHTLQEAFLPERLPQRNGLRFDALYRPAEREDLIGGDWYDALELRDGRIAISCGDVEGHGLTAAVAAGRIRHAIRFAAFEDPEPASVLGRVNGFMRADGDVVATALVAVLDPATRVLSYAQAGHPSPAIAMAADSTAMGVHGGLPLGVTGELCVETVTIALAPDSVVAFYTDGITDFDRDIAGAEAKLLAALARLVGDVAVARPAISVERDVIGDAASNDDMALLVLQCSNVDMASLRFDDSALVKKWRFHSSDALTARRSRHELMGYLRELAAAEADLYAAELVIGEILANTVEHAPGLVEVLIDWTCENPKVTVRDSGPGIDGCRMDLPEDVMSEDGRGMFLIGALASEISVRRSPGYGTELKLTLPLQRAV